MKQTGLFLIMFTALMLVGRPPAEGGSHISDNMVIEHFGGKTIRIVNSDTGMPPEWFVSGETGSVELKNPPATQTKIFTVKASPDQTFIAVLSASEGHPEIDIFNLKDVISDIKTSAVRSVDPYPGVVDILYWDEKSLHISSNMYFNKQFGGNKRPAESLTLFSPETFILDISTGQLKPASEKLEDPVVYYGSHLLSAKNRSSLHMTLNALDFLHDIKALPFLEKAVEMSLYSNNKTDIQRLINKLDRPSD